jgi:toxin ParE1/3/4
MALRVLITAGAERDLVSIHAYVAESDGAETADRLLRRLLELGRTLAQNPDRGSHP